ncbi:MAG: fructokinase [Candidatus Entotheonella factor]|uniref:fructokinase n=1 Tax=Entotheonella factor TaxID=1429438 RepID=W4LFG6_ENTF1|nr:MAG: fructokinase [Candidatus Entotheonella factor]
MTSQIRSRPGPLYGALEAGGTKWVCAVGTGPDDIRATARFATTTPDATIAQAIAFFRPHQDALTALGIGSFGPLDPAPGSPTFGWITDTPKPGWAQTDLAGAMRRALGVPVAFDTDVNAAALGEYQWGAAQHLDSLIYLTVGTGLGGGAIVHGRLIHGLLHPEMGHIRVPHDWAADPFPGTCPFHGDCLEGLASGPALEARWGQRGETLPADHPAWPLEAQYLAHGVVSMICILSPQRLILGGGVMLQTHLFPRVRTLVHQLLNRYIRAAALLDRIDTYIVPPALGERSGVLGAMALARALGSNATNT